MRAPRYDINNKFRLVIMCMPPGMNITNTKMHIYFICIMFMPPGMNIEQTVILCVFCACPKSENNKRSNICILLTLFSDLGHEHNKEEQMYILQT